ncbi:Uncharacterised protein [Mycobacteroides abscessus subsp. massiliense]|nr:Uncharacterised protein [Mycobacteroides abscessus subsp. massiliense]
MNSTVVPAWVDSKDFPISVKALRSDAAASTCN